MPDDQLANPTGTGALLASRYRLTGRVGRGGMADVFAADDELLHRRVAVKVFRFDTPTGDDQRRVDAEIRTLAGMRHPGLVTVFDAGSVSDPAGDATPYIVMELIDGPSLSQRLAQGPLGGPQTAMLGTTLAATLAYVHEQGVVHRDIKPANVLLDTPTGSAGPFAPKLTDFGIAVLLDSTRLTMAGMTVGTANYLSPEQATTGHVSPSSDIYSLGLVLLECLTGELAYPGTGVEAAIARLHRQPDIPAEFGPGWTALLVSMTDRDPDRRPAAGHVADVLAELAAGPATMPAAAPANPPLTATQVLSSIGELAGDTRRLPRDPAQPTPAAAGASASTRPHPGATLPAAGRWHGRPVWQWAAAVLAVLVVITVVIAANRTGGTRQPTAPPAYPSVSGNLGNHLRQLEGTVG